MVHLLLKMLKSELVAGGGPPVYHLLSSLFPSIKKVQNKTSSTSYALKKKKQKNPLSCSYVLRKTFLLFALQMSSL